MRLEGRHDHSASQQHSRHARRRGRGRGNANAISILRLLPLSLQFARRLFPVVDRYRTHCSVNASVNQTLFDGCVGSVAETAQLTPLASVLFCFSAVLHVIDCIFSGYFESVG